MEIAQPQPLNYRRTAPLDGKSGTSGTARTPLSLYGAFLFATLFYMIAFPKAGAKFYNIPITFGYLLTPLVLGATIIRSSGLAIPLDRLIAGAACALLAAWSAATVQMNGSTSFGFTLSFFISVVYLPLFGLVVFSDANLRRYLPVVEAVIIWSVRFIAAYGIFLFIYRQVTGQWIEIPYLTVNAGDLGTLDQKHINRGGIFKLISTYNNGNIFGLCACLLAPLYLRLEKKMLFHGVLYLAILLTLSRTAWVGLIAILLFRTLSAGMKPKTVLYLALAGAFGAIGIYSTLSLIGLDLSFVFDRQLGGRVSYLNNFLEAGFASNNAVKELPEIVYAGIVYNYGYFGLLLFLCYLLTPAVLMWLKGTPLFSPLRSSACLQAILLYAVLACADAAFSLIPVMMIFWMIAGLGLWYRRHERRVGLRA